MNPKLNLKNIIILLFTVSTLLLISHLAISFIYIGADKPSSTSISDHEIRIKFRNTLKSYAIKDEWIDSVKNRSKISSYKISIPSDLPIAQILGELTKNLAEYKLIVSAEEQKINGKTLMQIFSEEDVKLKAEFRYNSELQRSESKSSIFIYGREKSEAEYDSLIRNSPNDYAALLIPSKSSSSYVRWLRENGFEYAVLLNDDITELEFKIGNDYSPNRIKLIVQNLVVSFPHVLFYVFDKKSTIYKSSNYSVIKKELEKRRIKFLISDSLQFINEEQPNLSGRFNTAVKTVKRRELKKIAVSYDAFLSLYEEIRKLVRVGYKFVRPSELTVI